MEEFNLRSPVGVQLELTHKCNHRCDFCYNAQIITTQIEESLDKNHFLEIIKRLGNSDVFDITFTGGEPFLRKDVIYDAIDIAREYNMATHINTNLTKINTPDFDKLLKRETSLLVSIPDSIKEVYNKITHSKNYDLFARNLKEVVKVGLETSANMVVMQYNKSDIYETGKFVADMNVKKFSATPMITTTEEHKKIALTNKEVVSTLDDLLKLQKDFGLEVDVLEPMPLCFTKDIGKYSQFVGHGCLAGRMICDIDPYGNIRPCAMVREEYGNILEENLENIWTKFKEWRENIFFPKECEPCTIKDMCNYGCRAQAQTVYGKLDALSPLADPSQINMGQLTPVDEIDPEATYVMVQGINYRKEREGIYLLSRDRSSLLGNEEMLRLVFLLQKERNIIPKVFAQEHDFNIEKLKYVFDYLLNRKFIKNGK